MGQERLEALVDQERLEDLEPWELDLEVEVGQEQLEVGEGGRRNSDSLAPDVDRVAVSRR